jgi:hypothetical protein
VGFGESGLLKHLVRQAPAQLLDLEQHLVVIPASEENLYGVS